MGTPISNPSRRTLGYLMNGRRFLTVVDFHLNEEPDDEGEKRVIGDMVFKGRKPRSQDLEGPLVIHSNQGYSVNLEITRSLAGSRMEFRVCRAKSATH